MLDLQKQWECARAWYAYASDELVTMCEHLEYSECDAAKLMIQQAKAWHKRCSDDMHKAAEAWTEFDRINTPLKAFGIDNAFGTNNGKAQDL